MIVLKRRFRKGFVGFSAGTPKVAKQPHAPERTEWSRQTKLRVESAYPGRTHMPFGMRHTSISARRPDRISRKRTKRKLGPVYFWSFRAKRPTYMVIPALVRHPPEGPSFPRRRESHLGLALRKIPASAGMTVCGTLRFRRTNSRTAQLDREVKSGISGS